MKLLQGDCLELLKSVPDKSVNHFLCDLPYNILKHLKWDSEIIDLNKLYEEFLRTSVGDSWIIHFCKQPFTTKIMNSPFGKHFVTQLIWDKNNITNVFGVGKGIGQVHEEIMIFRFGKPKFFQQYDLSRRIIRTYNILSHNSLFKGPMEESTSKNNGKSAGLSGRVLGRSILTYSRKSIKNKSHPAQKNQDLLELLVKLYSSESETILDPTMGTGSSGIACKNLGRHFIGIEKDENYFKIASERLMEQNNPL
jgi:site-specific DNA-methyltransferase (adenine-specific)